MVSNAVYRADYRPPTFHIPAIDLRVDLDPEATMVTARLEVERAGDGPLVLDGADLELVSVALDGRTLAAEEYEVGEAGLTIPEVPDTFTLETVTRINPKLNTVLEGLYLSRGLFCTQCEAEGFRRITYFIDRPDVLSRYRTTIVGPEDTCPVLLSNGNPVEEGSLDDGRHYAVWDDPFPKPSYLFALVAGRLDWLEDTFETMSGRNIRLRLYTEPGDTEKCGHALNAFKKAMRWDEDVYGREYDLDRFNIVAVRDFNMGAMENKSLNIFNSKLLLTTPETATDDDHARVESVVAHEYFHNWTGNRVTCRDWFQLSLKEGLTVFRDQQFSAGMGSAAVERIDSVRFLRAHQFAEDDSPLAHPVRPDSYVEINNFYSYTVYEKGAEVIRMMHTLLGPEAFRKGMDLYFARHDGQAVTCDDFVQAMADASGVDLSQFQLWYSQAGTPRVTVRGTHDPDSRTYTMEIEQEVPPTPGQTEKAPMHIPLRFGLLDRDGHPLPLKLAPHEAAAPTERVISLKEPVERVTLHDVPAPPVPSLLRGFSAPVRLDAGLGRADLALLMRADDDLFNRWDAGQKLALDVLLERIHDPAAAFDPVLTESFAAILDDPGVDKALAAEALTLPSEAYLSQHLDAVDPDAVHDTRLDARRELARALRDAWLAAYDANRSNEPYRFTATAAGRRRLKNLALAYLMAVSDSDATAMAMAQFRAADNMTDEEAALIALSHTDTAEREEALATFYEKWRDAPLVLDKWFAVQARADRADTLERVKALLQHEAFDATNPNRVRALVGGFTANRKWFHVPSGDGYAFLASQVADIDKRNPRIAAQLVGAFESWRRFEPGRRAMMHAALKDLAQTRGLSKDVEEKVGKLLVGAD